MSRVSFAILHQHFLYVTNFVTYLRSPHIFPACSHLKVGCKARIRWGLFELQFVLRLTCAICLLAESFANRETQIRRCRLRHTHPGQSTALRKRPDAHRHSTSARPTDDRRRGPVTLEAFEAWP